MQEGSRGANLMWRERERAEKELTARQHGLPFKPMEKEVGMGGSPWARPCGGWRRRERSGPAWGRQLDHEVGTAPGGAVRGSSACSWWGRADE
jgi:hypothetical protein